MEHSDVPVLVAGARTLRVLHVIVGLDVGGAELMLKRLIESQSGFSDCDHSVVSLTNAGVIGPQLSEQGISVQSLGMKSFFDIPKVLWLLCHSIRRQRPDIVQTWMYHADLLGGVAARAVGVRKVIWGVRTTDIGKGGKNSTRMVRTICAYFSSWLPSKIVCAANASKKAHADIGYAEARMCVIPNGFEINRFQATEQQRQSIRNAYSISDTHVVIGSLGRFNPVKDHANFIAATGRLASCNPALRFMMVGRGLDQDNRTLRDMINNTGFPERYILLGERQDVSACLKSMDIFCLHSKTEGFPNVLGEAMIVGVPCVTTDVGDAALLLGENGIIVPPQSSELLADGLLRMLNLSHDDRERMVEGGRVRIRENFSMEMSSLLFLELYNSLG